MCRLHFYKVLKGVVALSLAMFVSACASTYSPLSLQKEPSKRYLNNLHPEVVLVLGSGSSRGFAHAGVLKALEDNHIPIDMIVGTSTGSIVGSLYADQPNAARLEALLVKTQRDEIIRFSYAHPLEGLFSGAALQHYLVLHMQATQFNQLTIPFIAVATDVEENDIHLFASGPIAPAVNASSAVAPFFSPVKLYHKTFVDGGYLDPVAVDVAKRFHPKLIIAVDLKYPLPRELPTNSLGILMRSYNAMLLKLTAYSAKEADILISPDMDEIGMFDGDQRKQIMLSGEVATLKAMDKIKQLCRLRHITLARHHLHKQAYHPNKPHGSLQTHQHGA